MLRYLAMLAGVLLCASVSAQSPGQSITSANDGMYVDGSTIEGGRYCLLHTYRHPGGFADRSFVMCGVFGASAQAFTSNGGAVIGREYLLYHLDNQAGQLIPAVLYAFNARAITPTSLSVSFGNIGGDPVYTLTRISGQVAGPVVTPQPQPPLLPRYCIVYGCD